MASYRVGQPSRPSRRRMGVNVFLDCSYTFFFCVFRGYESIVFSAEGRPDSHFVTAYKSTESFRFTSHHACQLCHLAVSR